MTTICIPDPRFKIKKYELVMTEDCNLQCAYCYNANTPLKRSSTGHHGSFADDTITDLLRFVEASRAQDAGVITFVLFGGEPFLYFDRVVAVMERIKKHFKENFPGVTPRFDSTTNLTTVSREQMDYLAENKVTFLVSIDGERDSHDRNRGAGTFDVIMKNMAYLYAKGSPVQVRMTVSKNTIHEFRKNFLFLNSLGYLFPNGYSFWWNVDTFHNYTFEELNALLNDLRYLYTLKDVRIFDDALAHMVKRGKTGNGWACVNPFEQLSIMPDGRISFCSRCDWEIGNLKEGIVKYDEVKCLPFYTGIPKEQCQACPTYTFCKGACLAKHLERTGARILEYRIDTQECTIKNLKHIVHEELSLLRKIHGRTQ